MEHKINTLEEQCDPHLPGAMITFASVCSTGSSENQYGIGDMDISLHRPGQQYPWLDLGRINFSNPTQSQYLDAETSPQFSEGRKAFADIERRLSKLQATYIVELFQEMMMKEFKGVIPPDDEIQELRKQHFGK